MCRRARRLLLPGKQIIIIGGMRRRTGGGGSAGGKARVPRLDGLLPFEVWGDDDDAVDDELDEGDDVESEGFLDHLVSA